ncbi:MAG: peptidoglycan DD-metalloendopeptidase family protein [Gemmatimonadales bacterium]
MGARTRRTMRTAMAALAIASTASALTPQVVLAQQSEMEKSRQRLDEIRRERERLRNQQQRLSGQLNDAGAALRNIERQRQATTSLVNEIEQQIGGLGSQLERSAAELALAQDNLVERRAVLRRRLTDIYKRGPLYTFQVLLAAESFGDLLTRYKYLFLTSRQDRTLMEDVEQLTARVQRERNNLLGIRGELDRRREEREAELERYSRLADERQSQLTTLGRRSTQTKQQLTSLERDEARLNSVLADLARRASAARAAPRAVGTVPAASPATLSTADIGKLDWPVDGRIVFEFGRDTLRNGGVIIWNGIGIAADAGTPVKAVEAGTVAMVQRLGTYGLAVIIEHGDGYYSLYMQLRNATVQANQKISKGQVVGAVGGENSDHGAHLYFEIRGKNQIALDPMAWLRRRG